MYAGLLCRQNVIGLANGFVNAFLLEFNKKNDDMNTEHINYPLFLVTTRFYQEVQVPLIIM